MCLSMLGWEADNHKRHFVCVCVCVCVCVYLCGCWCLSVSGCPSLYVVRVLACAFMHVCMYVHIRMSICI